MLELGRYEEAIIYLNKIELQSLLEFVVEQTKNIYKKYYGTDYDNTFYFKETREALIRAGCVTEENSKSYCSRSIEW